MTHEPEVTVIIPTRNRRGMLSVALASALAQEEVSLEVIVIDDDSADDTQLFLDSLEDARLRVLRQSPRSGVSAARNRGIEAAHGTWLAFLDDDDRWLPNRLRVTIDTALEAGADFAYGDTVVLNSNGRQLEVAVPPPADQLAENLRLAGTIVGPSSVIASADLVRRTGDFDTELSYLADWELWLRFALAGRGAHCAKPLVEYVQHPGSMLMDRELDIVSEFAHLRSRHPEVEIETFSLTRWVAGRYREEGKRWRASALYFREAFRDGRPGSLLRAVAVLFGERVMRVGKRARRQMLRAGVLKARTAPEEEVSKSPQPSRS